MSDIQKVLKTLEMSEAIADRCVLTCVDCGNLNEHIYNLNQRIAELENANKYWFSRAAVEEKQRWIPVSEMLPEIDKEVLIYDGYREMVVGWLEGFHRYKYFRFRDERWHGEVTHWMPLPESPNDTQKETGA